MTPDEAFDEFWKSGRPDEGSYANEARVWAEIGWAARQAEVDELKARGDAALAFQRAAVEERDQLRAQVDDMGTETALDGQLIDHEARAALKPTDKEPG